jgi:hypothetical protein
MMDSPVSFRGVLSSFLGDRSESVGTVFLGDSAFWFWSGYPSMQSELDLKAVLCCDS